MPGTDPPHELSDGTPLTADWTPVRTIESPERLSHIRDALATYGDDGTQLPPSSSPDDETTDPTVVEIDRSGLNERLEQHTSADRLLSAHEFTTLVTSLIDGDAAVEYDTGPSSYARYTFAVDLHLAQSYFDQWIAAATNKAVDAARQPDPTETSLVATLPPDADPVAQQAVDRTDLQLQTLLNRADSIARIAAPYFDPDERVFEAIVALPERGVETRVLTREVRPPHGDPDTRDAIDRLRGNMSASARDLFEVRDLYEKGPGGQEEAIHAKAVIVDESRCYLGSANLIQTALTSNFELGVLLEGPAVEDVVKVFDAMFCRAVPV
ncbi:phospholipase D family protein [Haloplanus litoreus]|uniref:phospholipase D-like domain-containing protein n=1 Tax=Haloplanus TaxID=376170 RepID=UPI0030F8CA5F